MESTDSWRWLPIYQSITFLTTHALKYNFWNLSRANYNGWQVGFGHRYRMEISNFDAIFFLIRGSTWGYSGFPCDQNTGNWSDACVYMHLLRNECEVKHMHKKPHLAQEYGTYVHEDHGCILFAFVSMCLVSKDPNTPNLSSMAEGAITQGSIAGLGSISVDLVHRLLIENPTTEICYTTYYYITNAESTDVCKISFMIITFKFVKLYNIRNKFCIKSFPQKEQCITFWLSILLFNYSAKTAVNMSHIINLIWFWEWTWCQIGSLHAR